MTVLETIAAKMQQVTLDRILSWIHRSSLIGFLLTVLFIIVSEQMLKWVMYSALLLYIFLGVTWINHSRQNGMNEDKISKQVAYIVLGTVVLMIAITILFKVIEAFSV